MNRYAWLWLSIPALFFIAILLTKPESSMTQPAKAPASAEPSGPAATSTGTTSNMFWGVNGHPMQGGPYASIPIHNQMADTAALGLSYYRMDVYNANADSIGTLGAFVAAGNASGVRILPILIPNPLAYGDESAAYSAGYALAYAYASHFKNDIHVWELGNEYDSGTLKEGDGSSISNYDAARYALVRGTVRGMLDGIHKADPLSKGIINTTGVCHFGFLDGLRADGVYWDITGEHWYALSGDITHVRCASGTVNKLALLQNHFHRPIWITEFNDNRDPADKTAMARYLTKTAIQWTSVAKRYDIQAAFVYELYDEPKNPGIEGHFGVYDQNGKINDAGEAFSLVSKN